MDPELPDSFSWWCLKTIFGDYQVASADDSVRVSVILCQWVQWWVLGQVSPGEPGGTAGDIIKDDLRGCQCVQWFPTCVMAREWNIWSGRSYSGSIMPKEPPANPHVSQFCFSFFVFFQFFCLLFSFISFFCFCVLQTSQELVEGIEAQLRLMGTQPSLKLASGWSPSWQPPIITFLIWLILSMLWV